MTTDADTLAEAVRLALGHSEGHWVLCLDCGSLKHSHEVHRCRAAHAGGEHVEMEGLVIDIKRRANSYGMG